MFSFAFSLDLIDLFQAAAVKNVWPPSCLLSGLRSFFLRSNHEVRAGINLCRWYTCFLPTSEGSATLSQTKHWSGDCRVCRTCSAGPELSTWYNSYTYSMCIHECVCVCACVFGQHIGSHHICYLEACIRTYCWILITQCHNFTMQTILVKPKTLYGLGTQTYNHPRCTTIPDVQPSQTYNLTHRWCWRSTPTWGGPFWLLFFTPLL